MSRGSKMSMEVGQIASKLSEILGCPICGMGLAIDIVGARWGEPPHDWLGGKAGHVCAITKAGKVPDAKMAAVEAVVATLGEWTEPPSEVVPAPKAYVDSRLPVERDEQDGAL